MKRNTELVIREVATGQDKVFFSHRADRLYLKDRVIETVYKLDNDPTLYDKAISDKERRAPIRAVFTIIEPIKCDTVDDGEITMVRELHLLENYSYYTPLDSIRFKYSDGGPDWYPSREATRVLPGDSFVVRGAAPQYTFRGDDEYPEVCSCGTRMIISREDGILCPSCDFDGARYV